MFTELIDKLKVKKKQLQNLIVNDEFDENKMLKEESQFDITISSQNNIYKIEISDYISIDDYIKKMKSSDEFHILDLICNCVLWNSKKQKVNKGTYYVIVIDNCIYNILFTDEKIKIDERIKIENITEERVITFDINKNEYHYFSAKHDKTGDTFYTRYYDKNRLFSLGSLDMPEEETYNEVNSLIYNLEGIEGIKNILDMDLLKEYILEDLSIKRKKKLNKKLCNN